MPSKRSFARYNLKLPPEDMICGQCAEELHYLDRIEHAHEPDIDEFLENFSIQQTEPD